MDAFLHNLRKRNDIYKLHMGVLDQLGSRQSSNNPYEEDIEGGALTTKKLVKQNMNLLLSAVLKVFHRMSRP